MILAKNILRTNVTYLPTSFPVHYYGMPNGKIYLIFSRFCKMALGNTGVEFVFAEHQNYLYDYENENIIVCHSENKNKTVYTEQVDAPNTKFRIIAINKTIRSYNEALLFLNSIAMRMRRIA